MQYNVFVFYCIVSYRIVCIIVTYLLSCTVCEMADRFGVHKGYLFLTHSLSVNP